MLCRWVEGSSSGFRMLQKAQADPGIGDFSWFCSAFLFMLLLLLLLLPSDKPRVPPIPPLRLLNPPKSYSIPISSSGLGWLSFTQQTREPRYRSFFLLFWLVLVSFFLSFEALDLCPNP